MGNYDGLVTVVSMLLTVLGSLFGGGRVWWSFWLECGFPGLGIFGMTFCWRFVGLVS